MNTIGAGRSGSVAVMESSLYLALLVLTMSCTVAWLESCFHADSIDAGEERVTSKSKR